MHLGPHIALFTIKVVQRGKIDLKTAKGWCIMALQKCSEFGPAVYPVPTLSFRNPEQPSHPYFVIRIAK